VRRLGFGRGVTDEDVDAFIAAARLRAGLEIERD